MVFLLLFYHSMFSRHNWFIYALCTTVSWGIWGAFIEIPEQAGFPATLGYVAWALTMVPCALVALKMIAWQPDRDGRAILRGSLVGFSGAGGQLILFQALREGPAYLVFPFISLFPILTILLSFVFLREKANGKQWAGIVLALIAIFFLSYQPQEGTGWILLALLVFILWGVQAFVMKFANTTMNAESIFFYMTLTGILLTPAAWMMTDFSIPIYTGFKGPYLPL